MKIVKIANGVISGFVKQSAWKITYVERLDPMNEKTKVFDFPTDDENRAREYARNYLGRNVGIQKAEQIASETPAPQQRTAPDERFRSQPTPPASPRKRPSPTPFTQKPTPSEPLPQKGYRIRYYSDMFDSELKTKVYDVPTKEEALNKFRQEFPKGIIEGNPVNLSRVVPPSQYDETGKLKGQSHADFMQERHRDNLPIETVRERLRERLQNERLQNKKQQRG